MAQRGDMANLEMISCPICLDLLEDPVTTNCVHSFCRSCINKYWDTQDQGRIHRCAQCGKGFTTRPTLRKNTMLADLVEEMKRTRLQAAPADHCYAGAEDVACDICSGRKLKAQKSCLQCLISFCEEHLQPHFHSPAFQKHKLVEPSKKLQENICSLHNEVKKMFCRTDQQSICHICVMDQHKGHDMVSAAAERTERQRELQVSQQNIQQRIQHRERDVKLLQQEVEAINGSADKAVEKSEKIFTELICVLQQRRSDVKQQLRSQQEAEVSGVKELEEKLEQEISELKTKDKELEKLSLAQDHNQFLQDYPSLSQLREPTDSSSISERTLRYFEDMTAAVSELRDKLQNVLRDVLLSEPWTRDELLRYSRDITLDPNSVHTRLFLSDENTKVTLMSEDQPYPDHPERFIFAEQVLSKESLTGRCYWEVELNGGVDVAVSYKTIKSSRRSKEFLLGFNNQSWALYSYIDICFFMHNNIRTRIPGNVSSRVGVYLDHSAGILSFYSVSETVTLIHRVQTTFTEPLHAGLRINSVGDSAEFCKLK